MSAGQNICITLLSVLGCTVLDIVWGYVKVVCIENYKSKKLGGSRHEA
jgi:hypothetical protein